MPLITVGARLSAFNDGMPWHGGPPFPDGAIDQADRQTVALSYAGILAAAFADVGELRSSLRAFLLDDADIAAAVGARIYPNTLLQGVRAASIVYRRLGERGDHHMQGPSGLRQARMELACWSPNIDDAAALARLVKARLDGYAGPMTHPDVGTIIVQGAFYSTARHDYRGDVEMYGVLAEYQIWHELP